MLYSLLFFGSSLQKLDVSIAYAVWSALGTAFVSAVGIAFFGEQFDAVKVSCIFCIIAGVIGLNLRDAAV
jgi:small multidrug resistance pump